MQDVGPRSTLLLDLSFNSLKQSKRGKTFVQSEVGSDINLKLKTLHINSIPQRSTHRSSIHVRGLTSKLGVSRHTCITTVRSY